MNNSLNSVLRSVQFSPSLSRVLRALALVRASGLELAMALVMAQAMELEKVTEPLERILRSTPLVRTLQQVHFLNLAFGFPLHF